MPWQDRIREPAYTSPSGVRQVFTFEDVSREFDKRTSAFQFPDAPGTYVQDLGRSGYRYPLRVIFWGDDHDEEAVNFEGLLAETGFGRLEHPFYGVITCVPFGTIRRRDDLKTSANQTILEVVFWETIVDLYPTAQADPRSAVVLGLDAYTSAASQNFTDTINLETVSEQAAFKGTYESLLGNVQSNLQVIADTQEDVRQQFNTVLQSVETGIDILVEEPLNLAFQTVQLIKLPGRAATNIRAKLDGFKNLADSLISDGTAGPVTRVNQADQVNNFRTQDLFASTATAGSIESVLSSEFTTKPQALEAAEFILNQFNEFNDWRDGELERLSQIDTGDGYQQLQQTVAETIGFLVEISFSLKQERFIILDRARTPIDLEAELYGTLDENLDFLINSNDLSGSEHLEIPEGREIVYYV